MALSQEGRNYGIDALRIVSMWLVVILHILGQGGVLDQLTPFSAKSEAAWFLETMAYCAVNCYALISGFVGLYSKFKPSNLFHLWFQVFYYSILITFLFFVLSPGTVGLKDVLKAFLPAMSGQYWYFTAYFALFFFTPFLNILIQSIPKKSAIQLVVSLIVIFSIIPTLRHADIYCTNKGYSVLWLGTLYLLGAFIRKNDIHKVAMKWLILFLVLVVITWGLEWFLTAFILGESRHLSAEYFLTEYTSPTVLGSSIALFLLFANWNVVSNKSRHIIGALAPLSFGIYLIHTHPLVWDYLLDKRFAAYADLPLLICILLVLITAVCIVAVCMGIDAIRRKIFAVLHVREMCEKLQQRMLFRWNRLFE